VYNLEILQCFKYDVKLYDFNVIDELKLICIDKSNKIHLLTKMNNKYFVYKTFIPEISESEYYNEQILIDKENEQLAILFIYENAILKFFDLKLNLKANIKLEVCDSSKNF